MILTRSKVIWIGSPPSVELQERLRERSLAIEQSAVPVQRDLFPLSCGIVFSFDPANKGAFISAFRATATAALDHGLNVLVLATDESQIRILGERLTQLPEGCVLPRCAPYAAHEVAEALSKHDPQRAYSDSLILEGTKVSDAAGFFLRRAFSDCKKIVIAPLIGGRSDASVFKVLAEFIDGDAGPHPLPFFVKIDARPKARQEVTAYDRFVANYVPFTQRPTLDKSRCFLGANKGVLVGTFVERSVSLGHAARLGIGRQAIHSLFDDALRGWRRQAYGDTGLTIGLQAFVEGVVSKPIREKHVSYATTHFELAMSEEALKAGLIEKAVSSCRRGPIHADLHPDNVRVRNGEAILIDFCKADIGPLIADLASLEIALVFTCEARLHSEQERDNPEISKELFEAWQLVVDELYSDTCLKHVPSYNDDLSDFRWLVDCVRQLRLMAYAIESDPTGYKCLLAAYLLRAAANIEAEDDHYPRELMTGSYGLRVAERIIRAT